MPINENWLYDVLERLASADGELVIDFSTVRRIDTAGIRALEKLALAAHERAAKVTLSGVPIDVYKALKLVKLAPRFSYV